MSLPRYKWSLPIGHLVIDSIVLVWLWHAHALLYREKALVSNDLITRKVMFLQEDRGLTFEPRYISPSNEFLFLTSGNLAAALVSTSVRPEAHVQTRTKVWDPVWLLIHESVSFPLWLLVGVGLDSGHLRIRKTMLMYLGSRFGFAVFLPLGVLAQLGWRLEVLFSLALVVYVAVLAFRSVVRRLFRLRS